MKAGFAGLFCFLVFRQAATRRLEVPRIVDKGLHRGRGGFGSRQLPKRSSRF